MEADDDYSEDDRQVREVKDVKVPRPHLRKTGHEDQRHDRRGEEAGEDERGAPDGERGGGGRVGLGEGVGGVEGWVGGVDGEREPGGVEEAVEEDEEEERVRGEFVEGERGRDGELEEGREGAVA